MISADRVPGHAGTSAIVAVEIWRRNVHSAAGAKPCADLPQDRRGVKQMLNDLDERDSIEVRERLQRVEARQPEIQSERSLAASDEQR